MIGKSKKERLRQSVWQSSDTETYARNLWRRFVRKRWYGRCAFFGKCLRASGDCPLDKAQITIENVMAAAKQLSNQQDLVNSEKLSVEYMKWQKDPEELTPEEREAMEAKQSWQNTLKKRAS